MISTTNHMLSHGVNNDINPSKHAKSWSQSDINPCASTFRKCNKLQFLLYPF